MIFSRRAWGAAAATVLLAGCSSTTAGSPGSPAASQRHAPAASASVSPGAPSGTPAATAASDAAAVNFVTAIFLHRNAGEAVRYVDPKYRRPALESARFEIHELGSESRFEVGAPEHTGEQTVVPVKDVGHHGAFLGASFKIHLTVVRQGGSWYVNGFKKVDWDARVKPSYGANPAFTCTPGFVTRLRGFPVAAKVRHYPVANLTPSPYGLAGQAGLRALRAGELEVYYTRESTTLPQGPSRSMYDCFIRQVRGHGWTPDHGMNTAGKKSAAHGRLVFFFYDSGSRFKAGNELSVGWTPASRTHGQGAVLGVSIDPNQHLPDLPPPPK